MREVAIHAEMKIEGEVHFWQECEHPGLLWELVRVSARAARNAGLNEIEVAYRTISSVDGQWEPNPSLL